jgi:hypothetical protein
LNYNKTFLFHGNNVVQTLPLTTFAVGRRPNGPSSYNRKAGIALSLECSSQMLEETKHFFRGRQRQVAKSVHCGEKIEEEASARVAQIFRRILH